MATFQRIKRLAAALALTAFSAAAADRVGQGKVNVLLWFDTEDFINPESDDAALRIANDLTRLGVKATFKVVGEKARVLEKRGRKDVISALKKHSIGYHTNGHSLWPVPALYLEDYDYVEGAAEFERREAQGALDLKRIFGRTPICYGQPGSSWAPQSNPALHRMSIPIYLDEGTQVGLNDTPFWFSNELYVFNMGPNLIRPDLNDEAKNQQVNTELREAVARLSKAGGGTISTYFHPNEYVEKEFWDAVNFREGATPPRDRWKAPPMRTREDSEHCYKVLTDYVKLMQSMPEVRFITADDLLNTYLPINPPKVAPADAAKHLKAHLTFMSTSGGDLSASELLLQMLNVSETGVDGPTTRGHTTVDEAEIPAYLFEQTKKDFAGFVAAHHRLPSELFIGSEKISIGDFAATAAGEILAPGKPIQMVEGKLEFERYISQDPQGSYKWAIHPKGFSAPHLLEMARLQAWTLKPARLR